MNDAAGSGPAAGSLVWRVPPWQVSALFLLVTGFAALNIYGHPSTTWRVVTVFLAVSVLGLAVAALRYLLVADDDGIWVRRLRREVCVDWAALSGIQVVAQRGELALRLESRDGSMVLVPPTLVLPSRPMKIPRSRAYVEGRAAQLRQAALERGVLL